MSVRYSPPPIKITASRTTQGPTDDKRPVTITAPVTIRGAGVSPAEEGAADEAAKKAATEAATPKKGKGNNEA